MKKKSLSFSICIPIYKGSALLEKSLVSIFRQKFSNYEILIGDDNRPEWKEEIEKTKKLLNSFGDRRIKYFKNSKNIGYPKNIRQIIGRAKGDVIFLMAQDDILAKDALQKTHDAFFLNNNIGAVTRPYFWFESDMRKPVRVVYPPNTKNDSILSLRNDGKKAVEAIFGSISQLSGLAMMRKFMKVSCSDDIFTTHMYPFADIAKNHDIVFLNDYTVAVGIMDSQTRTVSSIYTKSPLETWINMFNTIYKEKEWDNIRKLCIKHIATHYTGLVQLKNYGDKGVLEREIKIHLQYYPKSIIHPKFWLYVLLTTLLPRPVLQRITDAFKRSILSKTVHDVSFNY